ncbi:MAG: glycosyltransferase 87 family protein [Leptospira sp.]|nr:glycosyltransferase 87 family protein [Leptospira sp.]
MWKHLQKSTVGGRILLGIFLVIFLINGFSKSGQKSDFLDYYHASERWKSGENLYKFDVAYELQNSIKKWEDLFLPENANLLSDLQNQTATYIYPPLLSFLLIPLTSLSEPTAAGLFGLINFLALCGILYLFLKPKRFELNIPNIEWFLCLVLFLNYRYIESHIQNNQVGILLILLVLLSLTIKNDFIAGLILALATSIKITPLVFIVVFVYEKRWKALASFFISMILWNTLPMVYNADYTIAMSKLWVEEVLGNALSNPLLRSWKNNQSLPSTLAKYFVSGADFVNQPMYGMPFFTLTLQTVKYIQLFITFLFGLPLLYVLTLKNKKWELTSLLFLASALFSGISWIHSFVICVFPIYLLLGKKQKEGILKKENAFLLIVLALPLITHRMFVGKILENVFLMFSILFYTGASLYLIILKETIKKPNESRN